MPNAYSRAAKAHTHDNEGIRLQKLLAQAGFGSRRKCEEIITEGRVEIDGELVTELGTRVDPKHQEVRVDGSRVRVNPNHVTLALNKPKRVLSAMEDPKGRYTLSDIVGDKYDRIFHMGRLDYDSEGLILMTNDASSASTSCTPSTRLRRPTSPRWKVASAVRCAADWSLQACSSTMVGSSSTVARFLMPAATARWSRLCCIPARTVSSVAFRFDRIPGQASGTHPDRPIKLGDLKSGSYRVLSQTEVRSLSKAVGL